MEPALQCSRMLPPARPPPRPPSTIPVPPVATCGVTTVPALLMTHHSPGRRPSRPVRRYFA
ncbi:hypothetical protein E2C01_096679 [Portunus trituberculatus]|uniref:Uncharacterized protein n=1 Tax=Portunus trituberculatus TaxID=210409 RepID=A0A5B7JYI7_PORTR|nr:hypothetical protein [Portunus trituberculatus]